ncbi:uncharacterized protein SCHCODRAFT_02006573 [Schizophyllum commune H4-8]|uniref:uncharacterized protein n=1 Tax=Schizophyllum commune (strain H4-8 / FGSC 9210) TaxID=578458 RepID=UPI00215F741D|nr:uncharacterized protein SCHCODRAFT_02006573 [Schizophyllum commune H4-8]KAI5899239.1 hypothetical protein SCHCODRAFT_02006573 [Schizophyllum commune H4-8]
MPLPMPDALRAPNACPRRVICPARNQKLDGGSARDLGGRGTRPSRACHDLQMRGDESRLVRVSCHSLLLCKPVEGAPSDRRASPDVLVSACLPAKHICIPASPESCLLAYSTPIVASSYCTLRIGTPIARPSTVVPAPLHRPFNHIM